MLHAPSPTVFFKQNTMYFQAHTTHPMGNDKFGKPYDFNDVALPPSGVLKAAPHARRSLKRL